MDCFRDSLSKWVEIKGDATAIVDAKSGSEWTWSEMDAHTDRVGNFLLGHNLSPGHSVVSMLPNSVDAILILLGCMKIGADLAPLPHQASLRETQDWINLTKPSLAVVPDFIPQSLSDLFRESGVRVIKLQLSTPFEWLPECQKLSIPPNERNSHLFLKTSGTTGDPKAMVFDTDRLWASGHAFLSTHDFVDSNSRFFNILPVSYLGGIFNLGLIPLAAGGSVVVAEPFSGRTFLSFWQDVERFDINVLWVVPTIVRGLISLARRTGRHKLNSKFSGVRAAFLGTAPIDLSTKLEFEDLFGIPLLENFALSETTFISSETISSRLNREQGSVGEPLSYIDLRFGHKPDKKSSSAEIEIKTPHSFLGYLDFNGTIHLPTTEDGFFRTGDLGHINKSSTLVIDGRMRDIVKKGGNFVSLREIEVLVEKHQLVAEAVAIPVPHEFYGEDFVLAIIMKDDQNQELLSDVGHWLHENLVTYKWPQRIVFCKDFPRTGSGKIIKSKILNKFE